MSGQRIQNLFPDNIGLERFPDLEKPLSHQRKTRFFIEPIGSTIFPIDSQPHWRSSIGPSMLQCERYEFAGQAAAVVGAQNIQFGDFHGGPQRNTASNLGVAWFTGDAHHIPHGSTGVLCNPDCYLGRGKVFLKSSRREILLTKRTDIFCRCVWRAGQRKSLSR